MTQCTVSPIIIHNDNDNFSQGLETITVWQIFLKNKDLCNDRSWSDWEAHAVTQQKSITQCFWTSCQSLDLILFSVKSGEYEDWMTVCITPSNWLIQIYHLLESLKKDWKYENMKAGRKLQLSNWLLEGTHSQWVSNTAVLSSLCIRNMLSLFVKRNIVLKPKITFLACCFLKLLCEGTYSIVLT